MTIAKASEFRSNQKVYLEKAFNGETVIISRPRNENVVLVNEKQLHEMRCALRMMSYLQKLHGLASPALNEINAVYEKMLNQPESIFQPRTEDEFMRRIERSLKQVESGETEDAMDAIDELYQEMAYEEI